MKRKRKLKQYKPRKRKPRPVRATVRKRVEEDVQPDDESIEMTGFDEEEEDDE